MKNTSSGGGATATQPQQQQQQQSEVQGGVGLYRTPRLGQNVVYRPKGGGMYIAFIFGLHEGTGLERRVDLIYTDGGGQRHELMGRAYGDQPECWEFNTALEEEQARVVASYLITWGFRPIPLEGTVWDGRENVRHGRGETEDGMPGASGGGDPGARSRR